MRSATAPKHRVRPDSGRIRGRIFAAGRVGLGRERKCCLARTLGVLADARALHRGCQALFGGPRFEIADTWTLRVIQEAFLGVRWINTTLSEWIDAPDVLADRLGGDRWLSQGLSKGLSQGLSGGLSGGLSQGRPPLQPLHGTCGKDFTTQSRRKPVVPSNIGLRLGYNSGAGLVAGAHLMAARPLKSSLLCDSEGIPSP
jgi:hypothetical protein